MRCATKLRHPATAVLAAAATAVCLDAGGAGTADGTKVILWAGNGGSNQRWSLRS